MTHSPKFDTQPGRPLDGQAILARLKWDAENPEAARAVMVAAAAMREAERTKTLTDLSSQVQAGKIDDSTMDQISGRLGM